MQGQWGVLAILGPLTAVAGLAASAGFGAYRRRRDRPLEEIPCLRADLALLGQTRLAGHVAQAELALGVLGRVPGELAATDIRPVGDLLPQMVAL